MIIGVTGKYCAGKDTVAELLQAKGFIHISLSQFIREEARQRNIPDTRENLIALGNELRRNHGNSVLAFRALQQVDLAKNYVITSIRHPAEVEFLKKQPLFTLFSVDASQSVRWQRMQERQRNDNLQTLQDFQRWEIQESSSPDTSAQQLNTVITLADKTIHNEDTLSHLQHELDKIISQVR